MTEGHILSLQEKPVLPTQLFTVMQTALHLDSGNTVIHHNVERLPTVSIFPITPKYELYVVSQYRYLYKKRMLEAIAGFVEGGKTPLATARKELHEEAGIEAAQLEEFARINLAGSVIKATSHLFLARELTFGQPNPEEDEDIQILKIPLSEAVEKVLAGEITTAASITGILMLDRLRKEKRL